MANAVLVSTATRNDSECTANSAKMATFVDNSGNKSDNQNTPVESKTCSDSLSCIRESLKKHEFSERSTAIIMESWRSKTKGQYSIFIRKWLLYCCEKQISGIQVSLVNVIDFLTKLFDDGAGYSAINTARSSLSAIGLIFDGFLVGKHPMVIRFLKGVFNLRPSLSRSERTWDVNIVLQYLKKLSPVHSISFKNLTLKLAMLIALVTAGRSQTLHLISIDNIHKETDKYILSINGLLKQSRPGSTNQEVELRAYPPDRKLCVVTCLKEYLLRTSDIRKETQFLFISYIKPHKRVSRETISRWIKCVMQMSGIDISVFSSHSTRSASVSKAKENGVPISHLLKIAGWSNSGTFLKYYDKNINKPAAEYYQKAVLICDPQSSDD
ncbi:hypothetical protein SNE40_009674 [Patella caerulea]|uniref:Tyr recombinase domain-containing protein n=1 Tax=Patella caerulea TaxID=87958 RepID=A0AAN8JSN5_PATCE